MYSAGMIWDVLERSMDSLGNEISPNSPKFATFFFQTERL